MERWQFVVTGLACLVIGIAYGYGLGYNQCIETGIDLAKKLDIQIDYTRLQEYLRV